MAAAIHTAGESAFARYLAQERQKDLLRFLTCGSVDDGKSTLIGRLLYDSRNVFEDQIRAAEKATRQRAGAGLDLSLLTDGLRAEREQGITIDVAYRYFATARRKFIIADTPGHEQYTRNMATGASTADLAILLIDARLGVLAQSRRHACIASLLGIRHYVVAVNKMDLVDYDGRVFEKIREEFSAFLAAFGIDEPVFLPMSALAGDNVVARSLKMPWFHGPSLLEHLETVEIGAARDREDFRMPVQCVTRPDDSFRGYAGTIAAGAIRSDDRVTALPSGLEARVARIVTYDGDLDHAFAPMAVTVELDRHLDISRGDVLFAGRAPHQSRRILAELIWMDARGCDPRRRYLLKHTTRTVPAQVTLRERLDIETMKREAAAEFAMNAIGTAEIVTARPLFFDSYHRNRTTGSFILIDAETNATAAAGMIRDASRREEDSGPVQPQDRIARWGHRGAVIRAETRALALRLERALFERGCAVAVADRITAAENLAQAGMLAILPMRGARAGDVSALIADLEREGILRDRFLNTDGGGI